MTVSEKRVVRFCSYRWWNGSFCRHSEIIISDIYVAKAIGWIKSRAFNHHNNIIHSAERTAKRIDQQKQTKKNIFPHFWYCYDTNNENGMKINFLRFCWSRAYAVCFLFFLFHFVNVLMLILWFVPLDVRIYISNDSVERLLYRSCIRDVCYCVVYALSYISKLHTSQ